MNVNGDATKIAVLGLGPMGRALASAFAAAGHAVTVWNRTPGRAAGLIAAGSAGSAVRQAGPATGSVVVAESVAEAVSAADLVVACLIDDAAVRRVVAGVDFGGRPLVNLTSSEPGQARELAAWAASNGISYLAGAILTPTPMIGTPTGTILLSGDPATHRAAAPTLSCLGGRIIHLGPDPSRASAFDVALLDLFATATTGLLHAFALATAEGITPTEFAPFATAMGALLPEMATRFATQLETGDYPGTRSTIASAASTLGHITTAAEAHALDTALLDAVRAPIDRAIAQGHGADGLGRLGTMFTL